MDYVKAITALFLALVLAAPSASASECASILQQEGEGTQVAAGRCENVGSFSVGGLYEGSWEKLTYNHPTPWAGTFMTVKVGDKLYSTSAQPRDAKSMDEHIQNLPSIIGGLLTATWKLPEGIVVEQSFQLAGNGTLIKIKLDNFGGRAHYVGVRLHLDTLIGVNDGAPIYVPGYGLATTEKTFEGGALTFPYWKAFNTPDEPSIVATGTVDPARGVTLPDRVVIADWKQSKNTAWDYNVTADRSILGDSALLLYYDSSAISPGESRVVYAKYGAEAPVVPKSAGVFAVTELVADRMPAQYCPGDESKITVDVASINTTSSGVLRLTITSEDGKVLLDSSRQTGTVGDNTVKSVAYSFKIPQTKSKSQYTVTAALANHSGHQVSLLEKKFFLTVDAPGCTPPAPEKKSRLWLIIPALLFLILIPAAVILMLLLRKGEVVLTKTVTESGIVQVRVKNNTRRKATHVVVEDRLPAHAEADVTTLHVDRKAGKLLWKPGPLAPGEEAVLEYKVKGASVLPRAHLSWHGGELDSE